MAPKTSNVLVLGHSYVRRLQQFRGDFDLNNCSISFAHQSGANISHLSSLINTVQLNEFDVIFLQIGGNDITGHPTPDHYKIPKQIHELAKRITSVSKANVFIGQLYSRQKGKYLPTSDDVRRYNSKARWCNTKLKSLCKTSKPQLWKHRGIVELATVIIGKDGTHLTPRGLLMLWRSIRGAIISILPRPHGGYFN